MTTSTFTLAFPVAESAKIQNALSEFALIPNSCEFGYAWAKWFLLVAVCFGVLTSTTCGQEKDADESIPIYQREPYDLIALKKDEKGEGGGTFRVRPLDFPGRQVPAAPSPSAKLQVEVWHAGRFQKAELAWRTIEKVELFEELVLAAAESFVAQRDFERAYDYYHFLQTNYPQLPGLSASQRNYIYRSAGALYQQKRYAESLALLSEVFAADANHPGAAKAIADVTNQLLDDYMRAQRYGDARRLIEQTARRNSAESLTVAGAWTGKLQAAADAQAQQSRTALAAGRFRQAHEAAARGIDIWPESPASQQALAASLVRYPIVRVGVASTDSAHPIAAVPDRLQLRQRRLVERPLVELDGFAATGGRYSSPFGNVETAGDLRSLNFDLKPVVDAKGPQPTGYNLSRRLWEAAAQTSEANNPLWQALLNSVDVDEVYRVHVELQRPHVAPLAVLAHLSGSGEESSLWPGDYAREEEDVAQEQNLSARFVLRSADSTPAGGPRGPSEVVELQTSDPQSALSDLREARLDVLERVDPALAAALADDENLRVGRYAVPSTHVLVPNVSRPFPASRTFRRALAYAIPRERILQRDILAGAVLPGSQVVSGPLPVAYAADQAWGYGYDESIGPLPYDPRMGLTLLRVAEDELTRAADQAGRPPPEFTELVIGHGDDWLHQRACMAIAGELRRIGIACRWQLLTAGGEEAQQCDFIYAELVMTEPAVDLPLWLAGGELAGAGGYLALAARDVTTATNWRQVRQRLQKVHAALHAEQSVIPLWQLVDHFAYRTTLSGVGDDPVSLYQHIENWQIKTSGQP